MRIPVSLLVVLAASSSCVSAGTYDDLLMVHERTKRDLREAELVRDQELRRREATDADLKRAAAEHEAARASDAATAKAEHARLQALLEQSRTDLGRASEELAATLKDKAGLKDSVAEMQTALTELNRRKAEADRRLAEFKGLLARFQTLIDAGKLKVKIVDGRMVVALASDILFSSGSAALSKDGNAAVVEVAGLLASIPDRAFQVEGHTDAVPIKTTQFPSNWELASARALTVLKTMVDAGLPASRVSAASYGDQKPAASNDSPEGKAQNRRIEIALVPDLSTLPGFDELQRAGK
jgi:chemotaxis protein MotB